MSNAAWDDIDADLLSTVRHTPASVAELATLSGLPADLVSGLVLAYVHGGWMTRLSGLTTHYELTLLGHAKLRQLEPQPLAKAA